MKQLLSFILSAVLLLQMQNLGQADQVAEEHLVDEIKEQTEKKSEPQDLSADLGTLAEAALDTNSNEGPVLVDLEETDEEKNSEEEEEATAEGNSCYRRLVRLVGGKTKHEGRLEVFYRGRWGSVCGRSFGLSDAHVACRQLGYSRAMAVRKNIRYTYGYSRGPIYMDRLHCRGNEPSLFHCGHRGVGVHSCNHKQDVGVICYKSGYHTLCDRRYSGNYRICLHRAKYDYRRRRVCGGVLVRYQNKYGTICDDSMDGRDARVICRQLGYSGAGRSYTCGTRCGGRGRPIWLNNLRCRGSESRIVQCPMTAWGRHNCGHNEDIGVCCNM